MKVVARDAGGRLLVELGETGEPSELTGERRVVAAVVDGRNIVGPVPLAGVLGHGNGSWVSVEPPAPPPAWAVDELRAITPEG